MVAVPDATPAGDVPDSGPVGPGPCFGAVWGHPRVQTKRGLKGKGRDPHRAWCPLEPGTNPPTERCRP